MSQVKVDVVVPGSVWHDALDPLATEMQADLGLPEPERRKIGRGSSFLYRGIEGDTAEELADYLIDRGATLSRNTDEASEKSLYRRLIETGDRIRGTVARKKRQTGVSF